MSLELFKLLFSSDNSTCTRESKSNTLARKSSPIISNKCRSTGAMWGKFTQQVKISQVRNSQALLALVDFSTCLPHPLREWLCGCVCHKGASRKGRTGEHEWRWFQGISPPPLSFCNLPNRYSTTCALDSWEGVSPCPFLWGRIEISNLFRWDTFRQTLPRNPPITFWII